MEKGLLFFTLSIVCLWIMLDEFFGNKYLSKILKNLTPDLSFFGWNQYTDEEALDRVGEIKDSIDKNDNIKTPGAKDAVKEVVDKIYIGGGGLQET